jgi:hypothetical protein
VKALTKEKIQDALTCAFFLLGIDPQIRNINRDPVFKSVEIRTTIINQK